MPTTRALRVETFRPKLRSTVRTRVRSDGSAGAWDTATGRALEVAPDEAPLLATMDGERSLAGIAESHAEAKGFVPFTALRDLMEGLVRQGLLANPPEEIAREGLAARRRRNERWADSLLAALPVPGAGGPAVVGGLARLGLVGLGLTLPASAPTGWDVPWAYAGAALALTARGFMRAAWATLLGQAPQRLRLASSFLVLHLEPDGGGVALLDRGRRAVAHLGALLGAALTVLACWQLPGLAAGALAVLLADLIPFEPTSTGKLFSVMAGRVDLREHVRAYLSRRLLARAASRNFFDGEVSLIASLLASLGWFTLVIHVLFERGLLALLQMLRLAVDPATGGVERALALAGGGARGVAMPLSLAGLAWALGRAALSVRPKKALAAGRESGAALGTKDLAHIPVFAHLTPEQLEPLAKKVHEVTYEPGDRIVRQGDPGDRFFAIRSGRVVVEHELPSGLLHEVAHLNPGDCFGETALLENAPRSATVRALTPVTVAVLSRSDFEAVVATLGGVDLTRLLRAAAALHKSGFFQRLPADRLSSLALRLVPREVKAGAEVVRRGEAGHELFLVATGSFEVLDGEGKRIAELRPGDHFGEIALLRDVPRVATVRAIEDATVLTLDKDAFLAAMSADLAVSSSIESLAAERIGGAA